MTNCINRGHYGWKWKENRQVMDVVSYRKATEGILVGPNCSVLTGGWYSNLQKGQNCVELNAHMLNWGTLNKICGFHQCCQLGNWAKCTGYTLRTSHEPTPTTASIKVIQFKING